MTDSDVEDFFSEDDVVLGPKRDRWGRPLLIPRGGTEESRQWYTRSSSLADMIGDFSHLHKWQQRYLAQGIAKREDLALLAATEFYTTGFDRNAENYKAVQASGRRLDEIIERALDHVKIHEKADYGTAIHSLTEPGHPTEPPAHRPEVVKEVESFRETCARLGIKIIGTELFTACDKYRAAGTFDHLLYVPGYGIVVGDKKTSGEVHGHDYKVQLATYAEADLYDYETDARQTLEDYVASKGWDPSWINRDIGVIMWVKNGETQMHELDLKEGRRAAETAVYVRDIHRRGSGHKRVDMAIAKELDMLGRRILALIKNADSDAKLGEIWTVYKNVWRPEWTDAARARKEALVPELNGDRDE